MNELERLEQRKKAIEEKIKALKEIGDSCITEGNARLEYRTYKGKQFWTIRVLAHSRIPNNQKKGYYNNTNEQMENWRVIAYAEKREDAIRKLAAITLDLSELLRKADG